MNWVNLAILVLFLLVTLSVFLAVIFYIRHWARRRENEIVVNQITQGVFFKRYVPPSLYEKYDSKRGHPKNRILGNTNLLKKLIIGTVSLLTIGVVGTSLFLHQDKYLARIELTEGDLRKLDYAIDSFVKTVDDRLPSLEDITPYLQKKEIIILVDKGDDAGYQRGQKITEVALSHWEGFLSRLGLDYKKCGWTKLEPCITDVSNSIVIVLPGQWEFVTLESLLDANGSILLYGAPRHHSGDLTSIEWNGMKFESRDHVRPKYLALAADEKLTLGFDAGLIIEATPFSSDYRVFTTRPQAVAIEPDHYIGGSSDTRLYSPDLENGRLVWMDFSPDPEEHPSSINVAHLNSLVASVFRYLTGMIYSDIATWPAGKRFAAFFEMGVHDRDDNAKAMVNLARNHQFPISWFVLSDFAMENRRLTRKMASVGEMGCRGDFANKFTSYPFEVQLKRLARCKKVLTEITGSEIEGFSPPYEAYDDYTVNAMIDNDITYYNGGTERGRGVPVIEMAAISKKTIVSIPLMISDDYTLWGNTQLDYGETVTILNREIDFFKSLGALYPFIVHSEYMDDKTRLDAMVYLGKKLQKEDCYFATEKQISEWWRYRDNLRNKKDVDTNLYEVYRPVELMVDQQGKLRRKELEYNAMAVITSSE